MAIVEHVGTLEASGIEEAAEIWQAALARDRLVDPVVLDDPHPEKLVGLIAFARHPDLRQNNDAGQVKNGALGHIYSVIQREYPPPSTWPQALERNGPEVYRGHLEFNEH